MPKLVNLLQHTGDLNLLTSPGWLRGISTLLLDIIGGIILTACMVVYFHRTKNQLGKTGASLAIFAVAFGILAKTMTLWVFPRELMTTFLLLMGLKGLGTVLISGALYEQAIS